MGRIVPCAPERESGVFVTCESDVSNRHRHATVAYAPQRGLQGPSAELVGPRRGAGGSA